MNNNDVKAGDKVLVKSRSILGTEFYTAHVVCIKNGIFGKKYYCYWTINNIDYGSKYTSTGIIRSWNILGKVT